MLKPGAVFAWTSALPTRIWKETFKHLRTFGLTGQDFTNVTKNAILARDEDVSRVNAYLTAAYEHYFGLWLSGRNSTCTTAAEMMLKNFYRHPGTELYLRMVRGIDSYVLTSYRNDLRATDMSYRNLKDKIHFSRHEKHRPKTLHLSKI